MRLKAIKSFGGKVSMRAGEIREVVDEAIAKDLIRAGHAIEAKIQEAKVVEKPVENSTKSTKKKQ